MVIAVDIYCTGKSQYLPVDTEFGDLESLADFLFRYRYFIGRAGAEAEERAYQRVLVPLVRCDLIFESQK